MGAEGIVVAPAKGTGTEEYNVTLHTLGPTKSLLLQWREQDRERG